MAPDTTTGGRVGIAAEPDTSTQVVSAHAMCYGHEFAGNQLQVTLVSNPQNVPRSSNKAAGTQHEPIASAPVAGRKNKFGNSRTSFYLSRPGLVLVARCRACITQTSLPLRISMCPVFCMTWCRTSCLADQNIMHPWTDRVISTYACTYNIKTCQWSNLCLLISTVDPYIILLPLLFEFYTSCWNIPAFSSYIPQPLTTDISRLTSEADACCHTSNRYASLCSICQT